MGNGILKINFCIYIRCIYLAAAIPITIFFSFYQHFKGFPNGFFLEFLHNLPLHIHNKLGAVFPDFRVNLFHFCRRGIFFCGIGKASQPFKFYLPDKCAKFCKFFFRFRREARYQCGPQGHSRYLFPDFSHELC